MSPREVLTFLGVGGTGYVVDVGVFNLAQGLTPLSHHDPIVARTVAVVVATAVTYLGNRFVTWRHTTTESRRREISLFLLVNAIGFAISGGCLLVSHHLLGLTGAVADNVSANVVGVALGTAFRFVAYRNLVFAAPPGPVPERSDRILIVSASIGAGHDGVARELARRAGLDGYVVDRVDFLDLLPCGTGRLLRAAYHFQLRLAPATWGWLMPLLDTRIGVAGAAVTSRLVARRLHAACTPEPCLSVSTYPLASHALSRLRLRGELSTPVVTFLTDMSVHSLWVAPGVDAHLALHALPARAADALGARGIQVTGTAVGPEFRGVSRVESAVARQRQGLPDDVPLALVVGGSWGVGDVAATATDLAASGLVRPVVVCGSNEQLADQLADVPDVILLGWVDDMAALMQACHVVVQNAGGLTSLEARQCGLPVVTYRSIPGHGVTNSAALDAAGWARWARSPAELTPCLIDALTRPPIAAPIGEIDWTGLMGAGRELVATGSTP